MTFSVAALGTLPRVYQWQFNETNIADATTALLTVTNARLASAGSYRVVVGNDYGSTNSSAATLTVLPVVAWGAGTNNTGIQPNYGQSIVPAAASNVVAVAGGGFFSLGLKANGTVTGWGRNESGQTSIPSSATNVAAIAAGNSHSVALRSNGTVVAWGFNNGQTTVAASATNVTAVAAGWFHSLALRSNGTTIAWGAGSSYGTSPNLGQSVVSAGLSNVTAVAAGGYHSLALKEDGSVVAWGWNGFGQTNVPAGLSNVVAIAAGASNSVALRCDGTVTGWGDNTFGQTNVPFGLSNVVAVACRGNHVIALKENGTLVVWGDNSFGQTNVPTVATNVIGIAAGRFHSLAILNDGLPAIIRPPSSLTPFSGSDALLSVGAAGPGQLTYQWQINGANLEGETNSVLVVSNPQAANTGSYRVIATNDFGAVTSSVASLLVVTPEPIILSQSGNQTVLLRSNVTFNISAVSSLPIDYQWRFNGININGATNISLAVTNAQPTDEGNYSVVLSNAAATVESSNMFLDVIDLADALDTTNLVWTTSGSPQWGPVTNTTHDGIDAASSGGVPYPQQASLQTTVAGPGTLTFWWRASSSLGSMSFSVNGTNQSFIGSGSATWRQMTFYVAAGTHVLRWTCSTSYSFDLITGWLDQVSYVPGTTPAVILTAPMDRSVPAGTNVTFTVSAGGTPPLAYQWQFNGTNLSGVTGASLVLDNVQAANAGVYAVIVTNGYGSTNASATLIVDQSAPWIQTHPATKEMVRGGTVTFCGRLESRHGDQK